MTRFLRGFSDPYIEAMHLMHDHFDGTLQTLPRKLIPNMRKPGDTRLKGVKVLIADDAPDTRLVIGHIIRMSGATVESCANGKDAWKMALTNDYNILLMDIQMPVMDGFEATSRLREEGYYRPIIAITAFKHGAEREQCLSNGFDDYVSKPVEREVLIQRLQRYIDCDGGIVN